MFTFELYKTANLFNIIRGLWFILLISNVSCVNPSPSGIYRYDEPTSTTTYQPTSTFARDSTEETILPPPAPSVDVRTVQHTIICLRSAILCLHWRFLH